MAIPDFQSIMLPLLKLTSDKEEHSLREARDRLAEVFKLTEEERKELLPSGMERIFRNRVGWARTYLKQAGLLEYTKRGVFRITDRGLEVLSENPKTINMKYLERFPEYLEFKKRRKPPPSPGPGPEPVPTPEELMISGYETMRQQLAEDLLDQVKGCSPDFFERLVVDLLVKMGYGGSLKDAGEAVGKSGDQGIDGVIKEDRLGLDVIYIQAKRWEHPVGGREVREFTGALEGRHAKKGVFITTSSFSKSAKNFVSKIGSKVVLIDGEMLAQFMIDNNVGVSTINSYDIKKIDSDYFEEESL